MCGKLYQAKPLDRLRVALDDIRSSSTQWSYTYTKTKTLLCYAGLYVIHWWCWRRYQKPSYGDAFANDPDSKVHGANMKPTWVLSAPDGPHVGPMDLRGSFHFGIDINIPTSLRVSSPSPNGNALKCGLSNGAMALNSFHEPISGACTIQAFIVSFYSSPRSWSSPLTCRGTCAVPVTLRQSGWADEGPRHWVPQPRSCALCRTSLVSPLTLRTWGSATSKWRRTATPKMTMSRCPTCSTGG